MVSLFRPEVDDEAVAAFLLVEGDSGDRNRKRGEGDGPAHGYILARYGAMKVEANSTLNGICVLEKTGASVKEMNVIVDMALAQIRV